MSRITRKLNIESKEKEAVNLLRRSNQILRIMQGWDGNEKELFELEEPIRKGWSRYFIVRKDIAKTPENIILTKLLNVVQNVVQCDNKDFMVRGTKRKEWKYIEPELYAIREHKYLELEPALQKYFAARMVTPKWGGQYKEYYVYQTWKFESVIKPHYITHLNLTYPELESEYSRIGKRLWYHDAIALKYMDHSSDSDWDPKYKRAEQKREKYRALHEE